MDYDVVFAFHEIQLLSVFFLKFWDFDKDVDESNFKVCGGVILSQRV